MSKNSNIWNDYYKSYDKKSNWLGNEYPNEALVRFVSNLRKNYSIKKYFKDENQGYEIKNNFKGKTLEIGFGSLANILMLKKKGFSVKGLEVSKFSVQNGKKFLKKNKITDINLKYWDNLSKLPYKNQEFDLIVGLQCVYYNTNFKSFLREVHRVLKKDGKFIFSFFSNMHGYKKYINIIDKKKNIVEWKENHPNQRIVGCKLKFYKNKSTLRKEFNNFSNIKIFTYEFDQLPLFQSWWYVTGSKN